MYLLTYVVMEAGKSQYLPSARSDPSYYSVGIQEARGEPIV